MPTCGHGCDVVAVLKNLPEFIIVHALAIFWAVFVTGKIIYAKLTGEEQPPIPSKVRTNAPTVLNDPNLGSHGFLKLKVC